MNPGPGAPWRIAKIVISSWIVQKSIPLLLWEYRWRFYDLPLTVLDRLILNLYVYRHLQVVPLTAVVRLHGPVAEFRLHPNYPNPFNPVTTISFDLPEAVHASFRVYDVLGREVAVLLDRMKRPGNHSVTFDAAGFPSGGVCVSSHRRGVQRREGNCPDEVGPAARLLFSSVSDTLCLILKACPASLIPPPPKGRPQCKSGPLDA